MSLVLPGQTSLSFELKNAQLPMLVLMLKTGRLDELERDLRQRFGDMPEFFDNDPLLIDLSGLSETDEELDYPSLFDLLKGFRIRPMAIRGGTPQQMQAGLSHGLVEGNEATLQRGTKVSEQTAAVDKDTEPQPTQIQTVVETRSLPAMVVDKPLRSGQQVYARGRDLVVMAMVNPGAEVIADGHIHVYAPLRGKAMAGARGNAEARIFALAMEPELISIAGIYRTSENPLPAEVRGKPAQVRLQSSGEGDKLILDPIL